MEPSAILATIRAQLTHADASRIALCAHHAEAARAAMPWPSQGVHLRVLQRPVDVVDPLACWVCTAQDEGERLS